MDKLLSIAEIFLLVVLFLENIQMCFSVESSFGCIEGERQALLKLKQSFKDPSNRLVSWTGEDCCQWREVSCSRDTGHVVKLDLRVPSYLAFFNAIDEEFLTVEFNISQRLFAWEVSSCLAELKHLEYLDLSGNDFNQSRIPEFFGSLKHLTYLNISMASFGGKVPHQIGNLTRLKVLDLSRNYYRRPLYADTFQWASSLVSLQHLDMSEVDLGKALDLMQVLNKLPSLLHLQLTYCNIQNIHFDSRLFNSTFLASLQFLDLRANSLTGEIPSAFHNMTALRHLSLGDENIFSGGLYADNLQWVSSLSSLQVLLMSWVNLSKAYDLIQVLNTLPSLLHLSLSSCGIQNIHFSHGTTANSSIFASVQYLYLENNEFAGPVPHALANMTELRELDLSYNNFNSFVPLRLVCSKSLVYLNIMQNQFDDIEGGIFSMLNNACSLKFLFMSINLFRNDVFGSPENSSRCLSYSLESLHLSYTSASGNIPDWLRQIQSLNYLDLSSNSLSGPIPFLIGELSQLSSLDLSNNQLNGAIPQSLGELSSLKSLSLSYNQLNGIIPLSMGRLSELEYLSLSNNQLNGAIPQSLGELSSLKSLSLSYNQLHGIIPLSLGRLSALESLSLLNNQPSGAIPYSLGSLQFLVTLDLSHNYLNGTIPQSLGKLSRLEDLILSDNQLKGSIPKSLGMLPIVINLDLSNNQLDGTIPESLGKLSTLVYLRISHNRLTGIPNSIGQLASLYDLNISSNPLEGIISEIHFAKLSCLKNLVLSSTNLTWKVKSSWVPPFSLNSGYMSSCGIGFQFPQWLQTQNELGDLDLSHNNISGSFQQWINATSLRYLDLSMNCISENSLTEILNVVNEVRTLLLGNNHIKGSMPNSLCKLENLEALDLSANVLTGEIPNCWKKLQFLSVINLSSNKLSGKLPSSLGQLSYLNRFHVNNNTLEGELPLLLRNFTLLEFLDLGENRFSGSVPTWIGENLLSLRILRLRKNMLNGKLPPQLCQLSDLQILDLSDNNLIGEIPRCLGSLSGMRRGEHLGSSKYVMNDSDIEWKREKLRVITKGLDLEFTKLQLKLLDLMDLSSNKLVGVIPKELCLLNGLRGLNLSHNHLSGNIPNKIGDLKLLDTLDLSNNKLFGAIPQSMTHLPSISHLNLSNNNLSGKIPTSNQLQTLTDSSIYTGNIQLCGDPLPKQCPVDDGYYIPGHEDREHENDQKETILFWFIVVTGYITGLWAVIGTLVLKKNWRIAYFHFVDNTKERVLVMVAVKVARLKKKMQRSSAEE